MVRNAVPDEKALEPDHIRRARRADEDRASEAGLKQSHPAKNERPHDALAELGFGDQQRTQTFGRNEQGLDVALRRAVRDRRAPGELTGLSRELTRALFDDRIHMAQAVALDNREDSLEHDKHARAELPSFEQLLPVRIFTQ